MWIRLPLARLSGRMSFGIEDVDASIIYLVFSNKRWIPAAVRSSDVGVLWDEESLEYNKRLDVWMLRPIRKEMMHSINIHMIECDGDITVNQEKDLPLDALYAHCCGLSPPDTLVECMEMAGGARRSGWAWRQAAPVMGAVVMRLLEELPRCCDWAIPWDVMRPDAPLHPDPGILSRFIMEVYYTDPQQSRTSTRMVEFWDSEAGRMAWSGTPSDTRRLITKNMLFYIPQIPASKDMTIRTILPAERIPHLKNGKGVYTVFNPCIFRVDGVRRVCLRTSNYNVETYRSRDGNVVMTRNFIVSAGDGVVEVVPSYPVHKDAVVRGLEDMRFYNRADASGRLMFLANCCDFEGTGGMPVVVWGAVDPKTGEAVVVRLDYGGRVEKNWMPMMHDNKVLAVYSIDPLVILSLDGISSETIHRPRTHLFSRTTIRTDGPLDGAPLRGSGALAIADGSYLGVVHQVLWTNRGKRKYYHRFVRIDPASGSVVVGLPWVIHGCRIEYVLSILREDSGLTIAYSCMDDDARIMIVPVDSPFIPSLHHHHQPDPYIGWPEDTFWINRDRDEHRRRVFLERFIGIPTTLHRVSAEDGDDPGFVRSWPACAFVGSVHTSGSDEHQNVRTLALTLSHAKALDSAYHTGRGEWVLILEDDACLEYATHWPMPFKRMISAIPDHANLVLMSPLFPLKDLKDSTRSSLFCPLQPYGTTLAYIIRRSAIPEVLRAIMGRFPREPLGVSDMEIYRACPGKNLMTCIPWFTFPDDNTSTIHDQHTRFQTECKKAFYHKHLA